MRPEIFKKLSPWAAFKTMNAPHDPATATFIALIGGRPRRPLERAAGLPHGGIVKRIKGETAIRADDLIAVAHATGHDPVKALMDAGIIDQAPADDLRSIPDDILYLEVARRAADRAAEGRAQAWVASKRHKQ